MISKESDSNLQTFKAIPLLRFHLVITLLVISAAFALPWLRPLKQEVILGSLVSGFNFSAVCWALKNMFMKKNIALSLCVIVFKWPILGYALYLLVVTKGMNPIGLVIGLSSLLPAVLMVAWTQAKSKSSENI